MADYMNQRSRHHDYNKAGIYMLTMVVTGRRPLLGHLEGDADIPHGQPGSPHVVLTRLGNKIQHALTLIHDVYPMVELWRTCIMPDHIHLIIRINNPLPHGKKLGHVIASFKVGANAAYWQEFNINDAQRTGLFQKGYNDKVGIRVGQLDRWRQYLIDNPRRLLIKRQHPEYFTVLHDINLAGSECQMVGNRFLLDYPDKVAVIVHRRYTLQETEQLKRQWMECGARGGVLVSAAIAQAERDVMHEAMERGYKVIWLRDNGFPQYYKPSGRSFDACSQGRMLQISPWPYTSRTITITRQQCLQLNALAETIANGQV